MTLTTWSQIHLLHHTTSTFSILCPFAFLPSFSAPYFSVPFYLQLFFSQESVCQMELDDKKKSDIQDGVSAGPGPGSDEMCYVFPKV